MNDGAFEWDDEKAAANENLHGVSFETAKLVFRDIFAIDLIDDRADYGEERSILIGLAEATILTVVYAEREGRSRIISARRASRAEQDAYYAQHTGKFNA
jgi:hypothetical protein